MAILINGDIDIQDWITTIGDIPLYERNLDFSQIYEDVGFEISAHCPYIPELKENVTVDIAIKEDPYDDDSVEVIVYNGYITDVKVSGFYSYKVTVLHIFNKLKDIRVLNQIADEYGVYHVNERLLGITTIKSYIKAIIWLATDEEPSITYNVKGYFEDESSPLKTDFLNTVTTALGKENWGQSYTWDSDEEVGVFSNDPAKSPSLWDLLVLFQSIYHFSITRKDAEWYVNGLGFYYTEDYKSTSIPTQINGSLIEVMPKLSGYEIIGNDEKSVIKEEIIKSELQPYQISLGNIRETDEAGVYEGYTFTFPTDATGETIEIPANLYFLRQKSPFPVESYPYCNRIEFDVDKFITAKAVKTDERVQDAIIYTSVYARWVYPVLYNAPGDGSYIPTFQQPSSRYITKEILFNSIKNDWRNYYPLYIGYDFVEKKYILQTMELVQARQRR